MYKNRVDGDSGLFIIIMPFALGYNDVFIADFINKSVFVVDPSPSGAFLSGSGFPSPEKGSRWIDFRRLFIFFKVFYLVTASRGIPPMHLQQM